MKFKIILIIMVTGQALRAQELSNMTRAITANSYKNIHSILISKKGEMVYEHYFNGFTADSLHDSRSSFKSITSLLIGIALDHGMIKRIDEPVSSFFPGDSAFAADPRKKLISIKDLLEMRSGFDCDEWTDEGKDCESEMTRSKDWVKFSLALPMKNDPSKIWNYTSCDPMIVSGIIRKASGLSVMDFASKYLFEPMDITHYRWTVDPSGNAMTAGSFYILPADMVKLGRLVLNGGNWNGQQIVSQKWLNESTQGNIAIPDCSFTKFSRSKVAVAQPTYYGYYWYNEVVKTKDWQYPVVFASGNGGQYIMIVKELDLVVVFTQGNYESWTAKRAFDILATFIIPAARSK